jgi:uncharacterized repeat protein (TIGR01451 family)
VTISIARRLVAAGLAATALGVFAPLGAAQAATSTAPSSAADAYALDVDATLLEGNIPIDEGPFGRATQEFPPLAAAPAEAEELGAGPIPDPSGELVQNVGVLTSIAAATGEPLAAASAQAVDVALLGDGEDAMITADLIRAQSTTTCTAAPTAEGTDFVNLQVAGQTDPIPNPEPNTELLPEIFNPLGLRVILNEQHPTADGRGLVVNAIHIYHVAPAELPIQLFTGDIIVAHAMSTVNCPNGAGTTGPVDSDIYITKEADKAKVAPGGTVTYTANVKNNSDEACLVNQFIDHAPAPFELVSTSGQFGTVAELEARPGGGVDLILKPEALTIAAGATATQTFVLKVKDDAAPGVYFNNVEILCANLGNWVKGLDAPVEVTGTTPPAPEPPECSDEVDNDGDGKIDFPNDPGCDSPEDDHERDRPAPLPRTGSERRHEVLAGLGLLGAALLLRRKAMTA